MTKLLNRSIGGSRAVIVRDLFFAWGTCEARYVLAADAERLEHAGTALYNALRSLARVEAMCSDMPWC